jgi:DNA-binding transcriptional MocR family regulator
LTLAELKKQFADYKGKGLDLDMQRGQPSDANFDLSNEMLTIVGEDEIKKPDVKDIRNYPGGTAGLPEARKLFASVIDVTSDEIIVGNNSSVKLLSEILMWALIRGLDHSGEKPWGKKKAKMIVTVPGYDRHFLLLRNLGFEMVEVNMTESGPDIDKIEKIVSADPAVKGMLFVPVYSNPTGDTVSGDVVKRLARMKTAAKDFTLFADNAYAVHHLTDNPVKIPNLLRECEKAGNPDRIYIFGSTSKMTFAGSGVGFVGTSKGNLEYICKLMNAACIGPNKIEQYRHVQFLSKKAGGIETLMKKHAEILKPKFDIVEKVLSRELGGTGLAEWTKPKGGYFVSLNTTKPVADKVVGLAKELGVKLTAAGSTYPNGDPNNANIRIAPSRPPVAEVETAMVVVALCIKLASAEYDRDNSDN